MASGSSLRTIRQQSHPVRSGHHPTVGDPRVSDLDLIRAYQMGDEAAFDELFRRYQDYVYNVCLGILGRTDDARDCTQETFIRIYQNVKDFRAEASFSTWVYRIATNTCIGQLRKHSRVTASLEDECVRELPDEGPPPWQGAEREVEEQAVRDVLAELHPDYRVVLVLRYFQDLSLEEMTHVLGYNLGQLKVKLHRARRAFARQWSVRQEVTPSRMEERADS